MNAESFTIIKCYNPLQNFDNFAKLFSHEIILFNHAMFKLSALIWLNTIFQLNHFVFIIKYVSYTPLSMKASCKILRYPIRAVKFLKIFLCKYIFCTECFKQIIYLNVPLPDGITVDVPVGGIYFVTYEWLLQVLTTEGKS